MLIQFDIGESFQFQVTTQDEVNRLRKEFPKAVWIGMNRNRGLEWPTVCFPKQSAEVTAILLGYETTDSKSSKAKEEALRAYLEEMSTRPNVIPWLKASSAPRGLLPKT